MSPPPVFFFCDIYLLHSSRGDGIAAYVCHQEPDPLSFCVSLFCHRVHCVAVTSSTWRLTDERHANPLQCWGEWISQHWQSSSHSLQSAGGGTQSLLVCFVCCLQCAPPMLKDYVLLDNGTGLLNNPIAAATIFWLKTSLILWFNWAPCLCLWMPGKKKKKHNLAVVVLNFKMCSVIFSVAPCAALFVQPIYCIYLKEDA